MFCAGECSQCRFFGGVKCMEYDAVAQGQTELNGILMEDKNVEGRLQQ